MVERDSLTFGVVVRAFRPDTTLALIYDWVGSLDSAPGHFVLSNYNHDLMPTECIGTIAIHSSIVLNMRVFFLYFINFLLIQSYIHFTQTNIIHINRQTRYILYLHTHSTVPLSSLLLLNIILVQCSNNTRFYIYLIVFILAPFHIVGF